MKERLAGLVLGTAVFANGCGGGNQEPKSTENPSTNSSVRVENLGNLPKDTNDGNAYLFYKSTDKETGQVCYIVVSRYYDPTSSISCPITLTK